MELQKRLARNLKIEMDRINISNERLAKLSGLSTVTISNIKNGKSNPSLKTVSDLAKGLGIDSKILLRG